MSKTEILYAIKTSDTIVSLKYGTTEGQSPNFFTKRQSIIALSLAILVAFGSLFLGI